MKKLLFILSCLATGTTLVQASAEKKQSAPELLYSSGTAVFSIEELENMPEIPSSKSIGIVNFTQKPVYFALYTKKSKSSQSLPFKLDRPHAQKRTLAKLGPAKKKRISSHSSKTELVPGNANINYPEKDLSKNRILLCAIGLNAQAQLEQLPKTYKELSKLNKQFDDFDFIEIPLKNIKWRQIVIKPSRNGTQVILQLPPRRSSY